MKEYGIETKFPQGGLQISISNPPAPPKLSGGVVGKRLLSLTWGEGALGGGHTLPGWSLALSRHVSSCDYIKGGKPIGTTPLFI